MAIRNLRFLGDDLLRKKSRKVDKIDDRIQVLLDDMLETMYENNGVGLAAPQVGILKRVVVIDIGEGPLFLINPEIIEEEGFYVDQEGCLSVPGRQGEVKRPYRVKVKAQDRKGNEIIVEGEELLARALCHEIDHLNGILFVDKVIESEVE
ncbi:peptide deformylase [Clostridium cochlearium]|jgi:peptide deformylase|uniref:Peptide deformylase n=1 Tax=Clostridium cochlearium TaxID=1494 RepID=A0A239ZVH0_CLOCO|nr:peptide deformylase [Clostridium cochlearium]NSJ90022.1 peptide deformylase [Coprococcus sp. MSK.21.13]MBE6064266.1 peptide deformylase [Clostridium cochlearium]MBU5268711.1 peptide deformylase [Clostridium cochlearium]MCG4578943.1 peptide deformylase [Clostridium cochlearium]MCR1970721.1 peptide deformylase [Clostridium cochlearium]